MTHFIVGIIVPDDKTSDLDAFLDNQMDPYFEGKIVEPYVCYSIEQAELDLDRDIRRLEAIIERRESGYDLEKCRTRLAECRAATKEDYYRDRASNYKLVNAQGEPLSTINPRRKWNCWVIGGRWDGWITGQKTFWEHEDDNMLPIKDVLKRFIVPHAIVTPDGQWHERGKLRRFNILTDENEDWDREAFDILESHSDAHLLILDAHI